MSNLPLTVIVPGDGSPRFSRTLQAALEGTEARILREVSAPLHRCPVLFAVSLDEAGQNGDLYRLLGQLRRDPTLLTGSHAGILVDGGEAINYHFVWKD